MAVSGAERQRRYIAKLRERASTPAPAHTPEPEIIDPQPLDPIKELEAIAGDRSLAPAPRVAALKVLLTLSRRGQEKPAELDFEERLDAKRREILQRRTIQ